MLHAAKGNRKKNGKQPSHHAERCDPTRPAGPFMPQGEHFRSAAEAGAVVVGFVLALGTWRGAPRLFFGYLILAFVLLYWIDLRSRRAVFSLWLLYSALFALLQTEPEDNATFLVLSSLAGAAAIIVRYMAPAQASASRWPGVALGLCSIFPVQCNNLFFASGVALIRMFVFCVLVLVSTEDDWLVMVYPLFAKEEALPFLIAWHAGVYYFTRRRVSQARADTTPVLPVVRPKSSD